MINMIVSTYPIYDSEVARVFQFQTYHLKDIEKKVARYLQHQDIIIQTFSQIIEENLLEKPIAQFDSRFKNYKLLLTKKLDFIFWSYGKLLKFKS
ncbi:hypothetical protein [Lysinibacillus telephonicus]|uniref:hypothetical protein n=1 Tax=Lysinibacillus telephonicus TaxID=1714840 RepID=UPI000F8336C9|nr:hypothetical protein [Lysinibacillus telephonicus]